MNINPDAALYRLREAKDAFDKKQPTDFWIQCVRDASGRWKRYEGASSRFGVKYFRGFQPQVDYSKPEEVTYLENSLVVRQQFYEKVLTIKDADTDSFIRWLEELRRRLEYRPVDEWLHQRFATTAHTIIVREEVMAIAKQYNDPYASRATTGPIFPGFPAEALPCDKKQGELIEHHYPTLSFSVIYLEAALGELRDLLDQSSNLREYIYGIARFYQLLVNLHYFAAMNASLYMNMANGLLELAGIRGIENGIIDFVALRLQPETFQEYFYDEVIEGADRNG